MGKTKKTKVKFGIKNQIMVPSVIILIVMGALISLVSYLKAQQTVLNVAINEAKVLAGVGGNTLEYDKMLRYTREDADSIAFATINDRFTSSIEGSKVVDIYAIKKDETGNLVYATKGESYTVDDAYQGEVARVNNVFDTAKANTEKNMKSVGGKTMVSVFVPITNSEGITQLVIGTDYDLSDVMSELSSTLLITVALAVVVVIVAIILLLLIIGKITKRINKVSDLIYDLVNSDGDLTKELPANNRDELGVIAGHVNNLLKYIREVISEIASSSAELDNSVRASLVNTNKTNDGIGSVADIMETMSASMEETTASITQIGEVLNEMIKELSEMENYAEDSKNLTEQIYGDAETIKNEAVNTQTDVKSRALEMANDLNVKIEKSKSVSKIDELTEQILAISSQTNLLALNASIEAARAGDAGRGFAVVADEITKLADASSKTAEQIRDISALVIGAVEDLSVNSEAMLNFLNEVALGGYEKLVELGENYRDNAEKMNKSMVEIKTRIDDFNENMEKFGYAIGDVTTAVEDSTKSIVSVSETSGDLRVNTKEAEEDAKKNMKIAETLKTQADKFQV